VIQLPVYHTLPYELTCVTCIGPEMALNPFLRQIFRSQDQRRAGAATLSVSCLRSLILRTKLQVTSPTIRFPILRRYILLSQSSTMSDSQAIRTSNAPVTPNSTRQQPNVAAFQTYANQDLRRIIEAAAVALHYRGLIPATLPPPPTTIAPPSHTPDMWDNAKVEQIICAGLKPVYDGSPDKLIQTMNLIHIRCRNEVWCPATYIMKDNVKIDMVLHFSKVDRETILNQAKQI
jgi:hypothetical protein